MTSKIILAVKTSLLGLACLAVLKCAKPRCEFVSMRVLFTDLSVHVGVDTHYVHYILVKEFSKECLDSSTILNIVKMYIDTVKYDLPVGAVMVFNSDNYLKDKSEVDWDYALRDCLVDIGVDKATKKAKEYTFYNCKGEIIYEGKNWLKL